MNPNRKPATTAAPDHIAAHEHCIRHHDEIGRSKRCGCFYCLATFGPAEIKDWIKDGRGMRNRTALCPRCGIDSVIGSAAGYPITPAFLGLMQGHWFQAVKLD
jgi:hypothetical protein